MPEDFYAALMMRRALPTSTNIKTITAPGIYPVDAGNANAPVTTAGLLFVFPPTTRPTIKFIASDWNVYTLINGNWQGLGNAAIYNVTTSHTDTMAGHVLQVGDGGLLATGSFKMGTTSQFLAYDSADFDEVPVNGAGWQAAYAPARRAQAYMDTSGKFYSRFSLSTVVLDTNTPWAIHYTTLNKPTAADTGAVAKTGDSMTGQLNMDGVPQFTYKISSLSAGDTGTTNCLRIFRGGSGDSIFHERVAGPRYSLSTGNDASQIQLTLDASTGQLTSRGQVVPGDYGNFDIRYMAKTGAYTKSESDARYARSPNDVGFGGVGTYAFCSTPYQVSSGATVAGSSLWASGVAAQAQTAGWGDKSMITQGQIMAGTWMCCGLTLAQDGKDIFASLFYRIS